MLESTTPIHLCRWVGLPLIAEMVLLIGLTGCGGHTAAPAPVSTPPVVVAANPLASVVFLGDSLTAGFQNGTLLDSQQPNGYPSLLAKQAGFPITLPLIGAPGLPSGMLSLVSDSLLPVLSQASGTSTGRDNPSVQPTDLAVPGYTLNNLINVAPVAAPPPGDLDLTDVVLGLPAGSPKAQPDRAAALNPTAIFMWIGNNDALVADSTGMPSAMTPLSSFTSDFTLLMTHLKATTSAHLVVANVPDVTVVAGLVPAATLMEYVAEQTGLTETEAGLQLGIEAGDLLNPNGISQAMAEVASFTPGGTLAMLTDADVLTPAEIVTIQTLVDSYNQVIAQQVAAVGGTLVDLHSLVSGIATNGITINGYHATTAYLGGIYSLDGVHPTNTGYALLANQFITSINAGLGLSIPAVNVAQIAVADPYFGSNVKLMSGGARLRLVAGLRGTWSLRGRKQR